MRGTILGESHYIFYVSDMEELPPSGHFRKMDAGREIVEQIHRAIHGSVVKKCTEYGGELIMADSIGIVFPAHNWGVSLAVYSFFQNLKFHKNTYVYAIAVGESISGCVDATLYNRLRILEQFKRIFEKKCAGIESDIFIRCIDRRRASGSTEERIHRGQDIKVRLGCVLEGLLFHSLRCIVADEACDESRVSFELDEHTDDNRLYEEESYNDRAYKGDNVRALHNIFLDSDIFAGVRLCRAI